MSDAKWKSLYEEELSGGYVPPFTSDLEEEEEKPPTPAGPFGDFRDNYLEELGVVEPKTVAPTVEAETPTPSWLSQYEEELSGSTKPRYEPEPQESILRSFADPLLNVAAGINDVVKGFADAFGADNPVSQNLAKNSEWYRDLLSAGAKQDQEEIGRIMQEAEGQGVLAEIGAGLKALSVAPIDLVSQGIGSLIPFIATAGVGKAVGLSRAGIAVLQGVQGGAVGGGIVKGEIYDAVKEQLINSGVDEDKAEKAASEAQAYNGKNLDQILLGTGLGVAASTTGAEGAIRGLIARKVGKEAAEEVSERAIQEVLRTGFVRGAVKDGIVEATTEALQGGQEKLAANIAVGREGFDVDPMAGVFTQATLEGAIGGIIGGGVGGISAKAEQLGMRESVALRDAARAAEEAKQNNAPASAAAVENQIEQIGEALNIPATVPPRQEGETDQQWRARIERERAETPEQRVARLQEEATAAAGIELEEEGVGVEPTVPVTPPVTPAPEGAVAPVEPVVEPEVAEPQPEPETLVPPDVVAETVSPQAVIPDTEPADIPDTRGQGKQFHGARGPIEGLSEGYYNAANIYGGESTFYTTDAVDIAAGYQRKQPNAVIYQATEKEPVNFFDMEERRPAAEWEQMLGVTDRGLTTDEFIPLGIELAAEKANGTPNLREVMDEMRAESANEGYSRDTLQEFFAGITEKLENMGFGGMQHIGGLRTNRPQHTVKIYFKPSEQLDITPVDVRGNPVTPVAPTPEGVTPTPETPNLEPLRRVARAEQAPEDIPSLVEAGLVEVYKDQPVLTDAGLAALPEAERPRLTPEARKIQIDTGSNEVVAEAIAKNLRIGVDQVGTGVRMPAGWTLDGDIYVPPTPQEVAAQPTQNPVITEYPKGDVDERFEGMTQVEQQGMARSQFSSIEEYRKAFDRWYAANKKRVDVDVAQNYTPDQYEGERLHRFNRAVNEWAARQEVAPAPEVRESRREPSVEARQQYAPKTEEEQKAFDKASSNKVLARSPQLAVAAVRMKNGEITAGEYADLVDAIDPFTAKGADPIPTNEKIYQYMSKTMGASPNTEQGRAKLQKIGAEIPSGKVVEFRIDIPTYNESTKAGDTVYSVTAHEPVSETAKKVGETISHLGIAKVTNPTFMNRAISGKGTAVAIAAGAGKFPLATVKGNYEPITELPADINDPNVWTEVGYNPIRSSFFVDVRSKDAVVGGSEAIMVGSRVFVKDAVLEPRPTGVTMGERYARIQMPRPAGMETEAVTTKLESLGFGRGGIVSVVNEPDASFEGRTIIRDGKVVGIELNAAALKDDAAIERVLNHEIAESANADGALNNLVAGLTPKERKEINDAITRLGYAEKARTAEEAARAVELLAEGWRGRKWFERAVARIEAWANKLGYKLTRRAAEYIAARNVSEINAEFKQAYNKFINVQGEAREGRAFVTPAENARFLELAQNPEANREELQKMVDDRLSKVGAFWHGTPSGDLRGGLTGLHVGTKQAAMEALEARIGIPADGKGWNGDREYGQTLLAGRNRIQSGEFGKYRLSGYNVDAPAEDYYPTKMPAVGGGVSVDPKWKPWLRPVLIIGGMTNIPSSPISDAAANRKIKRKRGAYYKNEGEDAGSISAVLPDGNSVLVKLPDPVTYDDQGNIIPLSERFQLAESDIRYSIRESRREDAIPTFSEGSPESSTLSTMAASMAKVDAASEGKPNPENKPTYKISEIASVWMDQGGDARQLQDLILENTLLSPANAQKVANAIAKQYDIQQSISTAFAETALGLSAEALPEGATLPKEVDPDRPKPVMQRLFDVFMGVRVPPVKLTVNEKTALKDQIRLKAAAFRDAKKAQKEVASGVVEAIKEMDIRGPIRPKQASALMKRAAMINFANEKSVDTFITYAEKVIENANYDKDLADAKLAQKRAKEIAKRKDVSSNQSEKLIQIGNIDVRMLDNPREFAEAANHYMRAFKSVVSPDYVVIPDEEMTSYLADKETEALSNLAESDYNSLERLANKYGVPISEVNNIINAQDVEKALLEYGKREIYEGLVTDKAKESLDALQRYDTTGMTMTQKKIVDRLLGVEADAINIADRVQLVRRIDNLLVNGRTNGLQKFVDVAEAQTMARKAARDKTFSNQMKAWVNIFVGAIGKDTLLFGTESQRKIALSIQSVADTFRNIFGKENMAKIQQMMGYRELVEGTAKFNNESRKAAESMAEFYEGLGKKHGKKAEDRRGLMAEGVASYLIQKFPNKSEADSIVTRRSVIREDIAERRRSGDKDQIADAAMIEEILNSIDGDTNAEILANLKKDFVANYESLVWLKDTFLPQYKDTLKEFDENYNDQVNNYDNPDYLPVKYSFRQAAELKPEVAKGINDLNSLQPKQSANTIKRIDYSTLPRGENGIPATIGYNLRKNVFGSLSDQLKKAYTSSAWTKIDGFLNSRSAIDVLGSEANVKFMSDRLRLLKDSQDRKSYERDGAAVVLDAVSVLARKIGIGMALGGYGQALKQAPDQMATTIANTGRADLQNQAVADLWRKDSREKVMKLLTKYSIGNRGDAAMGGARFGNQMESSYSNLERFFVEGDWAKVKFYANKTADVWLEILKKSDFLAAASGWMTYYQVALEKAGVEFTGWENEANLIDTDSARQEAAIYAESMIDLYQGSSDPTRMATLAQRGKSGYENAFKTIFLPFNSFVLQQRTRILSDAREALINATDEQSRRDARRGLAGTLFGIMIFHSMRRYALPAVSGLGAAAIYAMLGVDPEEPDEEKQREEAAFKLKRFYSEIAGNVLVGGFGNFIEQGTLDAFNQAAYFAARQINDEWVMDDNGEIMDYSKWKRDRAPFWYYSDYKGGVELGMFNIGFDQLGMAAETAKKMTDPELMDTLTEEERRVIYLSGLSEFLFTMRLNDTDINRMFRRMSKDTQATAKEREAAIRKIRSGR